MSPHHFTYRSGTSDDVSALSSLGILSYGQHKDSIGIENWRTMETSLSDLEKFESLVRDSNCFVCVHEGHIVGMVFFKESGCAWDLFEAGWSYIRLLGVDPKYQGLGIARQLMQLCLDLAKEKSEKIVALHTSEYMDADRHLYEQMGFKVLREIPKRFDKRYWLYTLEL